MTSIFFATDFHGSDICFQKFLRAADFYRADHLLMGGDYTGKEFAVVHTDQLQIEFVSPQRHKLNFSNATALDRFIDQAPRKGIYISSDNFELNTLDDYHQFYWRLISDRYMKWLDIAKKQCFGTGQRIFIVPGNDDPIWGDEFLRLAPFEFINGKTVELCEGLWVAGFGGSNPTPWKTEREFTEDEIAQQLSKLVVKRDGKNQTVLLAHVPPFSSGLDNAPAMNPDFSYKTLAGVPILQPVGSASMTRWLIRAQPFLALFGHVHECRASKHIGSTLCVNPGSSYSSGRLQGVLVEVRDGKVIDFQFTEG